MTESEVTEKFRSNAGTLLTAEHAGNFFNGAELEVVDNCRRCGLLAGSECARRIYQGPQFRSPRATGNTRSLRPSRRQAARCHRHRPRNVWRDRLFARHLRISSPPGYLTIAPALYDRRQRGPCWNIPKPIMICPDDLQELELGSLDDLTPERA
jgi:hypothetical protein